MERKKLLTVNIITYNHEKYISKCIDSVLEQKTDFDFIVRIFDDCSTDGTQEICRLYKEKYPDKIELHLAESNLGLKNGVLINCLRSYENIETPYYLYIEGDDYRINNRGFQMQIDALEAHPECSFCMGNTINYRDGKFCELHPRLKKGIYTKEYVLNHPVKLIFSNLGSRIARTKCIKIDYNNPNMFLFDSLQLYELIKQGSFCFIDKTFMCYNITGAGVSSGSSLYKKVMDNINLFSAYNEYSSYEFVDNITAFFIQDISGYYINDKKLFPKKKGISIKKIKHYLLPPIVLDIFNLPREILRFIKMKF